MTRSRFLQSAIGCGMACTMALVFAAGAFGGDASQPQKIQENQNPRGDVRFDSQPQGGSSQAATRSSKAPSGPGDLRLGELMELEGGPEIFRGTENPPTSSSSLRFSSTVILDSNTTGLLGGFITGDRKAGQAIIMRANTGSTSAWGFDGLMTTMAPIASQTIETWAKVSFFETYNDFAGCTGLPMNVGTLGVLVIDYGVDSNGLCDFQEFRQTDLVTGAVRKRDQANPGPSGYTPAIGSPAHPFTGLISNSSPIAPMVPIGAGDNGEPLLADNNTRFWILELGQRNTAGDDVIEGPNALTGFSLCTDPFAAVADDGCLAIFGFGVGGGRILFNDGDVTAPLVGAFGGGFYIDNWAGDPDAFECEDGPLAFGGVAFNHIPIALFGAEGPDCDRNGRLDSYDIALDSSIDDGTLDPGCAIADNGIPDVCDCSDCNSNGVLDTIDIAMGTSVDCNSNGVPDECELAGNDCNNNGRLDVCDVACVDANGVPIICDGLLGSRDCARFQAGPNLIPDECDIDLSDPDGDGIVYADCDLNGVVDVCERDSALDCNNNGQEDYCDIQQGLSNDFNDDGIPDECDNPNSHTITFESNHPDGVDFSYVTGSLNQQPTTAITGVFEVVAEDWIVGQFNDVGAEVNNPGFFDVVAGNIGGAGNQIMRVNLPYTVPAIPGEGVNSNSLRAVFAVSPIVSFADAAGADTWTFAVPKTQEISMDLRFPANQGGSTGELDLDFRGQFTDGGALFNSRVAVRFDTALRADCNNNGIRDLYDIMNATSTDVNGNGIPDECEDIDCNDNGVSDFVDIVQGTSQDNNNNLIPDECDPDCNNNGTPDDLDIDNSFSLDQNSNGIPDECELEGNDCDFNGIPDDVDIILGNDNDINSNGIPDGCDMADCNGNNIEDMCDLAGSAGQTTVKFFPQTCQQKYGLKGIQKQQDCNNNRVPDVCELAGNDCDGNGVPDECDPDCNNNGTADGCDILNLTSDDCNLNNIPDECESDCNNNGTPDDCEVGLTDCNNDGIPDICDPDCNNNGTSDACEVLLGAPDCDTNGVPDECDVDCDNNGTPDVCEIDFGPNGIPKDGDEVPDCNDNCILDECEPDCDNDGIPDACDDITFIPGGSGCNIVNPGAIDTQIVLITGATVTTTGFDWTDNAGQTMNLKVRIELPDVLSSGFLNSLGEVLINDQLIARFRPSILQGSALMMDAVAFTWIDNNLDSFGVPGANSFRVDIDNIFISRSQEALDCEEDLLSGDCDGNGVCDLFELAAGDANNNGILDVCEGACNDCNHNGIPDDLEISAGTAVDANSNGVIDDCELTDYSQDWELNFNTSGIGEQNGLDGQNGWAILQTTGYFGFVRGPNYNSNSFPQSGMDGPNNHFLVVRDNGGGDDHGVIMGPRADSLGEADIELWCWDMFLTSNGFGRYMFEIADICSDGNLATQSILAGIDSIPGNEDQAGEPYIDAINTGLEFRGGNVDNNPNRVTILADAGGGKRYDAGSGLDGIAFPSGTLGPQFGEPSFPVRTACIRIKNRTGTVNAMMGNVGVGPPWTNLSNFLFLGNRTETTPTGGDKQFIIRHADQSDGTTELWFDNLRYIARDDCDLDGVGDDFYLNYMSPLPGHNEQDANNDGILDRCQDCDNDCGGFPITFAQRGCLDPCEISAAACGGVGGGSQDCNGNGIPDHCDVAADGNGNFGGGAPIEIGPQAGLGCLFPGYICKVVRYVGASFDCNQNGIPDECDIANSVCDDCNGNGKCDDGEISGAAGPHCGPVDDVNGNDIPDECDGDCNLNGILDPLDIAGLTSQDLQPFISLANNGDDIPDECCVPPPSSQIGDFDGDGDVDAADYKFLIECQGVVAGAAVTTITGPTTATCVGCKCGCADLFPDGVIDEKDVVIFNRFITGPQ